MLKYVIKLYKNIYDYFFILYYYAINLKKQLSEY